LLVPDLDRRAKNSGAERWDGPWEVLETSKNEANNYTPTDYLIKRTGSTDYLIKRTGSRQQPKWQHIDNLKQTFEPQSEAHLLEPVAEEAVMKEAPASAPSYEFEEIVGEKGKSRKTKHFLVKYAGYEDAWWQPAKNLYCTAKVHEWDALDEAAKAEKTARAVVANPEDINLIMDLTLDKQTRVASLVKDICIKIGIKRDRIAAIVASPMCNTFTKLDNVN
jgi:hypothetical protein